MGLDKKPSVKRKTMWISEQKMTRERIYGHSTSSVGYTTQTVRHNSCWIITSLVDNGQFRLDVGWLSVCMCMCVCTHVSAHVRDVSSWLGGIAGTLPLLFCAKLPWLISWWGHIPSTFASPHHTFMGDEDRKSDNSDTPPLPPPPFHLHPLQFLFQLTWAVDWGVAAAVSLPFWEGRADPECQHHGRAPSQG